MTRETITPLLIPAAIVFGAIIIAGAVLVSDLGVKTAGIQQNLPAAVKVPTAAKLENVDASRGNNARLYGNPTAARTIVEFSDLECPFCARLHPTLKQIVDESGGTINWEYRHLPLPMHKNARAAAIASECVATLSKPENFWVFIEVLLTNIGKATPDFLMAEAQKLGISKTAYTQCLTSSEMAALVDADMETARQFGGSGTPFSLVVDNDSKTAEVVSGAVPYEQWQVLLGEVEVSE